MDFIPIAKCKPEVDVSGGLDGYNLTMDSMDIEIYLTNLGMYGSKHSLYTICKVIFSLC